MNQDLDHVVCAGCTLLCDDIRLTLAGDRLTSLENACELGKNWFEQSSTDHTFLLGGKSVEFEVAAAKAAVLLQQAKSPLICGLDGISTQSQIAAVKLARQLNATIDTTFGNGQRSGTMAMQTTGKVTATLGEVASRADVVTFWFCDPLKTHPRFFERFCNSASQIIVIDESATETSKRANQFIQIGRDEINSLISQLRLSIRASDKTELNQRYRMLGSTLADAQYSAVIYGSLDTIAGQNQTMQNLYLLVSELNRQSRSVAVGLRTDANALSGENVLSWNSGYPFGVNFCRGAGQHYGLEFSVQSVLSRGECDVAFICSTQSLMQLDEPAKSHLKQIPNIVINSRLDFTNTSATVLFSVGFDGGDWCRLDDVILPVSNVFADPAEQSVAANDVLTAIFKRCQS